MSKMRRRNLWKIGIVLGILIIIISLYLGYFVFNDIGCGKRGYLTVCIPTRIPHPLTTYFLGLGIFILLTSLIGLIIDKLKKSKPKK